jgi:hypothetical protein
MITPDNLHNDLNHHQQQQQSMTAMTPNPRVHFSQFPDTAATGGFHSPESNVFHHISPSTHASVEVPAQPNNRMHPQEVSQGRTNNHKKRTRRPD